MAGEEVSVAAWSSAAREQVRVASAALAEALVRYTHAVTLANGEDELHALEPGAQAMTDAVERYEDAHASYTGVWAPFPDFRPREGTPQDEDGVLIAVDREIARVGNVRCELMWARQYSTGIEFRMALDFRSDRPVARSPRPAEPGMRPPPYDEQPIEEDANWWIEVALPNGRSGRSWADPVDDDGDERESDGHAADLNLVTAGVTILRTSGKARRERRIWVPLAEMPQTITIRTAWDDGGMGLAEIDIPTI